MKRDGFSQYHPLTNFLFFAAAIGSVVVIQHPLYLLVSTLSGISYYVLLGGARNLRRVLGILPIALFIACINPFFNTYGQHILFHVLGRPYTLEALTYGAVLGGIFVDMMIWFGCYNAVLTQDKFTCLFGALMPSLSLLLIMVLRMIPGFIRKARQIAGARKSIGKGCAGNFSEKIKDGVTILSVMTDWALEGGIITADSMRCRGYGCGKRTSFRRYKIEPRDYFLLILMGLFILFSLFFGDTRASFTPVYEIAAPGWGLLTYGLMLLIPSIISLKEDLTWHILRSGI